MPQRIENVSRVERLCLAEDLESLHETWLNRLGNLTLTGYNSTYSNRPFGEKKATIVGGFEHSAVRLNKYVRNQN